jgi:hypothetical protein
MIEEGSELRGGCQANDHLAANDHPNASQPGALAPGRSLFLQNPSWPGTSYVTGTGFRSRTARFSVPTVARVAYDEEIFSSGGSVSSGSSSQVFFG